MAKVSLRIYNREIEKLIEQSRLDEAIAHCRHILMAFSKHLETYRLLGKAYLEAKRYAEAVDIFQRILISVPDDFVSHVGMSIISDDQKKLDDAIWHMERAFEVQPSNAAIQGELQRLFGRRDGVEPPKIRLTRGALAHMYMQGDLYNQAISEIKAVLSNDAQRTDMQVLLAQAYFRNGQKMEATDICSQLLRRFPYCFDANRVMVELLPGTQRAESTQVYRHRISELDPYAAFVQESIFRSDDVPDAAVNLERFEYTGQARDSASNWGGELGIGLESDAIVIGSSAQQPDWLKAASSPNASASFGAAPAPAPVSQPEEEIPAFFRQAGRGESSEQFQESPASFDSESESSGAVQADLPDWVKAMAPSAGAAAAVSAPKVRSAPSADTPDWLRNLGGDQFTETPSTPAPMMDKGPAWLKKLGEPAMAPSVDSLPKPQSQVQNVVPAQDNKPALPSTTPAAGLGNLGTSSQEQDDAMAWLESLASRHGAKSEELVTDPNARTDVAPEWVDKAKAMGKTPSAAASKESPDWLSKLSGADAYADITAAPEKEEASILGSDSAPDWLSEIVPASSEPTASPGDVPDWLAGLDKDENASQVSGSRSDLPSWLQGDAEPEITQPANPADWHPAEMQESVAPVDEAPTPNKQAVYEMELAVEKLAAENMPAAKPEKKSPATPRLKQTSSILPVSVDSLANAQTELGRGNISTALDVYEKLIRKGKFLEEIIRDLRDALYRYPVEVSIWQALGDAYMRGNRLQEALDAYTKAEELLR